MNLRLLQIVIDDDRRGSLAELLDKHTTFGRWDEALAENRFQANVLTSAEHSESLMDDLTERFGHATTFRVVVLSVEATLPRPDDEDDEPASTDKPKETSERISREELFNDVTGAAKVSRVWLAMVALSAIVAAVGLLRDNTAVIIGAMVIAPLLGPNVALALATTLGDLKLGRRALMANFCGVTMTLIMSTLAGLALKPSPLIPAIAERTNVSLADVVVGLAAGAAGTLAFTMGTGDVVVGVMVAVALMPPTVVCGMMIGTGHWDAAIGAGLLVTVNVICINLAGVGTFLAQGMRPRTWYEADVARKATRTAVVLWVGLLILLSTIVFFIYDLALWSPPTSAAP
ncbi:MAG: TIGR00341 family protein [Phycisphaera sp.]|nr:TIGR00341 family protein [Phycisphaera sp.]